MMAGECVCMLRIPGNCPLAEPNTELHFEFITWLNKLSTHEMFKSWRKDDPFPIPENIGSNYLEWDGSPDCITAYVDGSFDRTYSG